MNTAVVQNTGGGVCLLGGTPVLTNVTIAKNIGYGVYALGTSANSSIRNSIVASNSGCGVNLLSGGILASSYNRIYGNSPDCSQGFEIGAGSSTEVNPMLAPDWVHIQPSTQACMDAGDSSLVQPGSQDIDGQARIQDGSVDVGADESDGCTWYSITLTADPSLVVLGSTSAITATVLDPVSGLLVPLGTRVDFKQLNISEVRLRHDYGALLNRNDLTFRQ